MNYRKLAITLAVVALLALAGCNEADGADEGDELGEETGNDVSNVTVGGSYSFEVRATEKNQYDLVRAQPPFKMESSLERENLIKRYQYLNDRNNVHHVYMLGENGKVISYSMAQGKVSSVNSKLTNDLQIVGSNQCVKETIRDDESGCFQTVESPQMDGSYGTNGDAIFWFTTDGHYMEYNGVYVVSEEPKNIQTQPVLVDEVDSDGNNVSEDGNESA